MLISCKMFKNISFNLFSSTKCKTSSKLNYQCLIVSRPFLMMSRDIQLYKNKSFKNLRVHAKILLYYTCICLDGEFG